MDNVLVGEGAAAAALDAAYDAAVARLDQLAADGARPLDEPMLSPPHPDDEPPEVTSSMAAGQYQAAVEVAREPVFAGHASQVVLSQRFDFPLGAEPFAAYRALRQGNPSPYMYFVRVPGGPFVGPSPAPMVTPPGGRVRPP